MPLIPAVNLVAKACRKELATKGLLIHVPPFCFRIRTRDATLADAFFLAYKDYAVLDPEAFVDFDLSVVPDSGIRQWFRPLVKVILDGESPFEPLPQAQAFPLLEWAMNWCITSNAHQFVMFHSAVLARGDFAVILPAPPGSGKSTLCAALMMSGWRLLSDEIALVDLVSGQISPFVRPVSLKNASIPLIADYFPAAVLTTPVRDTVKGTVSHLRPTSHSLANAGIRTSPKWLIFPKYVAKQTLEVTSIAKSEAVVELAKNVFNLAVLGTKGLDSLVRLVDSCHCQHLRYSKLDDAIGWFNALDEAVGQSDAST